MHSFILGCAQNLSMSSISQSHAQGLGERAPLAAGGFAVEVTVALAKMGCGGKTTANGHIDNGNRGLQ